jgi:hypothetical protein
LQHKCTPKAMLVLERVPVPQSPPVPLKPQQVLQLPLVPGGAPIRFGRRGDCDARTDGPGVQAELSLDAAGAAMALTFRGTMPAPGARTTAKAPHGLRVVTPMPDEFFPDGRLKTRWSKLTQVTGTHALQVGETIVFTLHAAKRTCFAVRALGPDEGVAERAVSLKTAAVAAKKRPAADGSRDGTSKNARRRTRSSPRSSSCAV